MSWPTNPRPAKSLELLRSQINARWPARSKLSDGMIGDAAHQTRDSDHNAWIVDPVDGTHVVSAFDVTHDPTKGPDAGVLAETLRLSRDPRIKYIISNRRIANHEAVHGEAAWIWRPYFGKNPHDHHVHISVLSEKSKYDDVSPWVINIPPTGA